MRLIPTIIAMGAITGAHRMSLQSMFDIQRRWQLLLCWREDCDGAIPWIHRYLWTATLEGHGMARLPTWSHSYSAAFH